MSSGGQRNSAKQQVANDTGGLDGLGVGGFAITSKKPANFTSHYLRAPQNEERAQNIG